MTNNTAYIKFTDFTTKSHDFSIKQKALAAVHRKSDNLTSTSIEQ